MAGEGDQAMIEKVWIVQESMFGDYGNGEVYGVYVSQERAEREFAKHNPMFTDLTEATLTRSGPGDGGNDPGLPVPDDPRDGVAWPPDPERRA